MVTLTARISALFRATNKPRFVSVISAPASSNFWQKLSRICRLPPNNSTCPPAINGAIIYVPNSIRSVKTWCVAPWSVSTPSILITLEPSPVTFAPIRRNKSAKSMISGSLATFLRTVVPFAKVAAIKRFSVAPTDAKGNSYVAPFKPFGAFA